jgi:hypothetical protein
VLTELLPVQLNQAPPMAGLLNSHTVEHRRGSREVLLQSVRKIGVHAFVFFLEGNCQRENFALTEVFKGFHAG